MAGIEVEEEGGLSGSLPTEYAISSARAPPCCHPKRWSSVFFHPWESMEAMRPRKRGITAETSGEGRGLNIPSKAG